MSTAHTIRRRVGGSPPPGTGTREVPVDQPESQAGPGTSQSAAEESVFLVRRENSKPDGYGEQQ
jgi:hypothetical protein